MHTGSQAASTSQVQRIQFMNSCVFVSSCVLQGDNNGGPDGKSILQQQNHELAVDMRRRKRQQTELENKLAQAWAKQGHFDATLSAVNRAWSQASGIRHAVLDFLVYRHLCGTLSVSLKLALYRRARDVHFLGGSCEEEFAMF